MNGGASPGRLRPGLVGAWRSLVAHLHGGQGVAGSNPVAPTSSIFYGPPLLSRDTVSSLAGTTCFRGELLPGGIRYLGTMTLRHVRRVSFMPGISAPGRGRDRGVRRVRILLSNDDGVLARGLGRPARSPRRRGGGLRGRSRTGAERGQSVPHARPPPARSADGRAGLQRRRHPHRLRSPRGARHSRHGAGPARPHRLRDQPRPESRRRCHLLRHGRGGRRGVPDGNSQHGGLALLLGARALRDRGSGGARHRRPAW